MKTKTNLSAHSSDNDFRNAVANGAKVSVRYRKGSGTHVVYVSGILYSSGHEYSDAVRLAIFDLGARINNFDLSCLTK
jgi:hypothetical protein